MNNTKRLVVSYKPNNQPDGNIVNTIIQALLAIGVDEYRTGATK